MAIEIKPATTRAKMTVARDRVSLKPLLGCTEEQLRRLVAFTEEAGAKIQPLVKSTVRGKIDMCSSAYRVTLRNGFQKFRLIEGEEGFKSSPL